MTATTMKRRQFARRGNAIKAIKRFSVPRKQTGIVNKIPEPEYIVPLRSIKLGDQLHPDTGEVLGEAYLPLPTISGSNEAICVSGASGSGKSVLMRRIIEHFSIKEGRCVIVFDITKNQYWSFSLKQNRPEMMAELRRHGETPTRIPEVDVFVPIYDRPVLGWDTMQRDYHATHVLSLRTAGLTAAGFFELGDIDPSGRMYQNYLENILNVPRSQKTVEYIREELRRLQSDKNKARSISSLLNLFDPLVEQGIIKDDGTNVRDMIHPPHPKENGYRRPGKVTVLSLGTSAPNDRRKKALVTTILQQIFDIVKDDLTLKPVVVFDETKEVAPKKAADSPATYAMISRIQLQTRAWGVTRVYGYQKDKDVADWLIDNNTPYKIRLTKSLILADGVTRINGFGLGHVLVEGVGGEIKDMNFYMKSCACRTRHVD